MRIATWNIKHFNDCFRLNNQLRTSASAIEQMDAVAHIMKNHLQADLIGICEAPDSSDSSDGVEKLINFAEHYDLQTKSAMQGIISKGRQEVILLYNDEKVTVEHTPEGSLDPENNPRFDKVFYFDADDDSIREIYEQYRPPLEAKITHSDSGEEFWLMVVHAKSKVIMDAVDQVNLERLSRRNRLKLFAECMWIRQRIDDWLSKGRKVITMGDINDGPGMDLYEMRYGKSAVEVILGDVFYPKKLLMTHGGRPKYTSEGWKPASARFKDRITEAYINVLIDHILVSQDISVIPDSHRVWNPYQARQSDPIYDIRTIFKKASDHFPVSLDLNLP